MIVSRLPPSEPNGDVACAIHTTAFNCFVSSALVDGRWETLILNGDPGIEQECEPAMRFRHPPDCDAHDAALLNELVAVGLDTFGDLGIGLAAAADRVFWSIVRKGVILEMIFLSTHF